VLTLAVTPSSCDHLENCLHIEARYYWKK